MGALGGHVELRVGALGGHVKLRVGALGVCGAEGECPMFLDYQLRTQ